MTERRRRILCVHQGGELYGSDRSFLQAVQAIRDGAPDAHLRVVLAVDGPLRARLAAFADEVVPRDLAILRLATPVATLLKLTVALPYYLGRAWRDVAAADLVYINTTVVADYMLAARLAPGRAVIHAREIPRRRAMPLIRALCRGPGIGVIFNSQATSRAFALPAGQRQAVILNGVETPADVRAPILPERFTAERPLRVAMLGRINDWKGQDLLVEAAGRLTSAEREAIAIRVVGSPFGKATAPLDALHAQIAALGLDRIVALEPFQDDTDAIYRWADLCVVPSRLPEPFGRVAIEAMAHGRAVIAAAHGGLVEIVEDPGSGWLFAPNDDRALAEALSQAIAQPGEVGARGARGRARFDVRFSATIMCEALKGVLERWLPLAFGAASQTPPHGPTTPAGAADR